MLKIVTDEFYLDSIHEIKINVLNIHAYITRPDNTYFRRPYKSRYTCGTKEKLVYTK